MSKIIKIGTMLGVMAMAFVIAVPAQALITNVDIANNAGIGYKKLKLGGKIDSGNIKDGTITSKDIKNETIKSKDIKDGAITSDKLANDVAITTSGDAIFTDDVFLGDGDDDVVIDSDSWFVDVDGYAWFGGTTNSTGAIYADGGIANTQAEALAINANGAQKIILGGTSTGDIDLTRNTNALAGLDVTGDTTLTGDLAVNGDDINSDGALDITGASGANLNTTAGNITLDSVAGGAGNVVPGADSQDNIGTDATRWATIFADTLNYSSALTDANSANTTVTMGNDKALDTLNITANTTLTSDHWAVSEIGGATLGAVYSSTIDTTGSSNLRIGENTAYEVFIGASTHTVPLFVYGSVTNTGTLTTGDITAYGAAADAALAINGKGTGDITLGDADSSVTIESGLTVTAGGATVTAGGVTITTGGLDMTGDNITNIGTIGDSNDAITIGADGTSTVAVDSDNWDMSAAGAVSGLTGVVSTGTVDFSGAAAVIVPSGAGAPAAGGCDAAGEVGSLYIDTASAQGSIYVCRASGDWDHIDMAD